MWMEKIKIMSLLTNDTKSKTFMFFQVDLFLETDWADMETISHNMWFNIDALLKELKCFLKVPII